MDTFSIRWQSIILVDMFSNQHPVAEYHPCGYVQRPVADYHPCGCMKEVQQNFDKCWPIFERIWSGMFFGLTV